MKVCEASEELQNKIFEYFEADDEESKGLLLNSLLHDVRFELMQNYHYDNSSEKKLSMSIQRDINSLGT
jgi:hypothetical protein